MNRAAACAAASDHLRRDPDFCNAIDRLGCPFAKTKQTIRPHRASPAGRLTSGLNPGGFPVTKQVDGIDRAMRITVGLALIAAAATGTVSVWGCMGLLSGLNRPDGVVLALRPDRLQQLRCQEQVTGATSRPQAAEPGKAALSFTNAAMPSSTVRSRCISREPCSRLDHPATRATQRSRGSRRKTNARKSGRCPVTAG